MFAGSQWKKMRTCRLEEHAWEYIGEFNLRKQVWTQPEKMWGETTSVTFLTCICLSNSVSRWDQILFVALMLQAFGQNVNTLSSERNCEGSFVAFFECLIQPHSDLSQKHPMLLKPWRSCHH